MENTRLIPIELYHPHPSQLVIHNSEARFRVLVCGRRWGKTTLALNELIKDALLIDNATCWYVAPTYKQAKMVAWKMLLNMLPKTLINGKPNETELSISIGNDSEIHLKGADNEDSLRGVGIHSAILDEYSSMKVNVWQEIIRPMLTDTKGKALFIGTPKGKNHFWELFMKGQRGEDGFCSWVFPTLDNPYIDPKEVAEARTQINERYFKQEYEASFEDYVGLIWPEFNKDCIIDQIYLPQDLKRIGAIDPATTGTTGALEAAIDYEGKIIVYKEFYEQNKRVSEVAESLSKDIKWYIDPASKTSHLQKEGRLYSLFEEYEENGIHPQLGQNDVDAGINKVGEYLKQGKLKVFNTCKNLIYELERYHWSEERETVSGVMKPKPFKSQDHLCDCLRYLVMAHAWKPELFTEEAPRPGTPWGDLLIKQKQLEGFKYSRQ